MPDLNKVQGVVIGVIHDQVLVRWEGQGVLFLQDVLKNHKVFRHDDIVEFSSRPSNAADRAVGDRLSQASNYEIKHRGTDIKYIKAGRTVEGEGKILTMDYRGEFMFLDWSHTANPPNISKIDGVTYGTNVFCTKASSRPDQGKLLDKVYKVGQRVRFIAKEQPPNRRGVCWRSAIVTDMNHKIQCVPTANGFRQVYNAIPIAFASNVQSSSTSNAQSSSASNVPSSSTSMPPPPPAPKPLPLKPPQRASEPVKPPQRAPEPAPKRVVVGLTPSVPLKMSISEPPQRQMPSSSSNNAPPSAVPSYADLKQPPNVDGYDYYDCSPSACKARYRDFVVSYRRDHPKCILSNPDYEGYLQIKYLMHVQEQITVIRAATY